MAQQMGGMLNDLVELHALVGRAWHCWAEKEEDVPLQTQEPQINKLMN